ncbi:MAG TPA: tetratricopeptide repeat protein [Bacteroidales bacterium]|nr:tetratricopeptide repeat protein [Bacteroidales bacterium]
MEFADLRKKASDLRKQGAWEEALACYEELTFRFADDCTEWEYWGQAYCLFKLGKYREAETFCRSYLEKEEMFQPLGNVLAWALYCQYLRNEQEEEAVVTGIAEEITTLCRQEDQYSPYVTTVFRVLELLGKKFPYPADQILYWTGKLNPGQLDDTPAKINRPEGKEMELASRREQYYMVVTRALYESARYEECAERCDEVLSGGLQLHYDNVVWFRRRKALCLYYMGRTEEAIALMREVFARKKNWFVRFELGEMLMRNGEKEEGISLLASAAIEKGDQEKKLKLYASLANWYENNGMPETAIRHYALIWLFRDEMGWKEDDEVRSRLDKAGVDLRDLPAPERLFEDLYPDGKNLR